MTDGNNLRSPNNSAMEGAASPHRSPLRESSNQTQTKLPTQTQTKLPTQTPLLALLALPPPENSPPPHKSPSPPPTRLSPSRPAAVVNRAEAVTKAVDEESGGGDKGDRVVTAIVKRSRRDAAVGKAVVGVRFLAAVLTLISFSVMAADKTKGWAGDSFDRYKEYRYCITVNVLAFAYSSFQIFAHVHQMIKGKHIIRAPIRYYFDLFMDQILAYLLLSASSAAATMNNVWVSNWGNDPFTVMINGSVSMSFLAFATFAASSLISAYNLFSKLT